MVDSVAVSIAEDFGAVSVAVIEAGMVVDAAVGLGIKVEEASVVEEEGVGMLVVFPVDMAVCHLLTHRLDQVAALAQHMDQLEVLGVRRTVA